MLRSLLAIGLFALCCGCQNQARPANDPFWGRTRVPPPPTGAAGGTGADPYYNQPPASPGMPAVPTVPQPLPPGAATPMGVPPVSGGASYTYPGYAPPTATVTAPASAGFGRPMATPVSMATNPPSGNGYSPGSVAPTSPPVSVTPPVPAANPAPSGSPYGYSAPTNAMQSNPATPAPVTSPPPTPASSSAPNGYLPAGGMNYQGSNGPSPGFGDPNVTQVSAPVPAGDGLDSSPSVIRIPPAAQSADSASSVMPVDVQVTDSLPSPGSAVGSGR
jgi:hypothetical protein